MSSYESLDKLGYSKERSEKRVKIYDNASECLTRVTNRNWTTEFTKNIIAGSRGEGISGSCHSDIDLLFISPVVKCFEIYPEDSEHIEEFFEATFELDISDVPQGYTKLPRKFVKEYNKYGKYFTLTSRLKGALTEEGFLKNDERLIAAVEDHGQDMKREGFISANSYYDETTGPVRPLLYPLPLPGRQLSVDYVPAFPCSYPSLLTDWSKRERKDDHWPSEGTVKAVKESEVLVVPTGLDGSDEQTLQWRLSFTLGEQILVRSFNDTQIKVYVAMKMMVKKMVKSVACKIDSYVVKNVLFWVFERWSGTFKSTDFNEILLEALQFLRECVSEKCLKNYIVPSRNLLYEKLSEHKNEEVIRVIDMLINTGPDALRCNGMIENMHSKSLSRDDLDERLKFRQLSEELLLAFFSLKPTIYDDIEYRFHKANDHEHYANILLMDVVPIIKDTNPFNFFSLLKSMDTDDIKTRMEEGYAKKYDDIWME